MTKSMWMNEITGELLDETGLAALRQRARRAYHANTHIFEDEREALRGLGVVPLLEAIRDELIAPRSIAAA